MKNNCDCYRIESKRQYTYHPITGDPVRHDITVGVCWGTKEIDECSCGGDRTKCDFYPEVREKAKEEQKESNCLIVTYDCCPPDVPTLCVARKEGNKVKVLNTIQGDKALNIYNLLMGDTTLQPKIKQNKKRKYYRKCGICGERHEQSEMTRTNQSPNGWLCFDCHNAEHPEYEIEEW